MSFNWHSTLTGFEKNDKGHGTCFSAHQYRDSSLKPRFQVPHIERKGNTHRTNKVGTENQTNI